MQRKNQILLVVLGLIVSSTAALVVSCLPQPEKVPFPEEEKIAVTRPAEGQPSRSLSDDEKAAVLKSRERIRVNQAWWEPLEIAGRDGEVWFVPRTRGSIDSSLCWRVKDGVREDVGEFAAGERWIHHQAAALLSDGRLMVVWAGTREIAMAIYSGTGWSAPIPVARATGPIHYLDIALDAKGRMHLVYVSPLDPYESYGPFHGFFPSKCWHTVFDGENWTAPKPIQKRGRFDIDNAILTLTPSGRLVLAVETHNQSSPQDLYVAVQIFNPDKNTWSSLTKIQKLPPR